MSLILSRKMDELIGWRALLPLVLVVAVVITRGVDDEGDDEDE